MLKSKKTKTLEKYSKYSYAIDTNVDYTRLNNIPNLALIIGQCSNCSLKGKCLYFKPTYEKINKDVDDYVDKKKEEYKSSELQDWEYRNKCRHLDKSAIQKKQELYKEHDQDCKIEQKFASDILIALDNKYDFKANPEFKIMVEDIIIGKIKAFRFNNYHSMSGVIITDNNGRKRVAPGMMYGLEFAKCMADLISKMDIIKNGIKTVNVNIDTIPIPVKDLYNIKRMQP